MHEHRLYHSILELKQNQFSRHLLLQDALLVLNITRPQYEHVENTERFNYLFSIIENVILR